MLYEFTILTVSQQIQPATGTSNADFTPFSAIGPGGTVTLEDPQVGTFLLRDDDGLFQVSVYHETEVGQTLEAPLSLPYGGNVDVIPAGTQLSHWFSSTIRDSKGNEFEFVFPRSFPKDPYDWEDLGVEYGNRHSVVVVPVPKMVDGQMVFPRFDPTLALTYIRSNGVSASASAIPMKPYVEPGDDPCFAAGTLILTEDGPRPVEDLRPGMRIVTRDHGLQTLLWSGHRLMDRDALDTAPNNRPIRIAAGALGPGQPARDLTVSPQHRILLRSPLVQRMFDAPEVLAPARLLVGLPGIEILRDVRRIAYWHLLFAQHQILASEGAWTESLLPGPMALRAVGAEAEARIRALVVPEQIAPAHPLPKGRALRQLTERLARNSHRRPFEGEAPVPAKPGLLPAGA